MSYETCTPTRADTATEVAPSECERSTQSSARASETARRARP